MVVTSQPHSTNTASSFILIVLIFHLSQWRLHFTPGPPCIGNHRRCLSARWQIGPMLTMRAGRLRPFKRPTLSSAAPRWAARSTIPNPRRALFRRERERYYINKDMRHMHSFLPFAFSVYRWMNWIWSTLYMLACLSPWLICSMR